MKLMCVPLIVNLGLSFIHLHDFQLLVLLSGLIGIAFLIC